MSFLQTNDPFDPLLNLIKLGLNKPIENYICLASSYKCNGPPMPSGSAAVNSVHFSVFCYMSVDESVNICDAHGSRGIDRHVDFVN